jgi:hypothetical protein
VTPVTSRRVGLVHAVGMKAAKATSSPASKTEAIDGVCTGCTECGDRDTCECNFDEDLAFEAAPEQQPAEGLRPKVVAKRA